jgi:hypothetical protein
MYGGVIAIGVQNTHYTNFSTTIVNDGIWRNITLVVKPNGSGGAYVDLYINKILSVSNFETLYPSSSYQYSKICESSDNVSGGFNGRLYNFQYFDSVLSSDDISNIYELSSNYSSAHYYKAGLKDNCPKTVARPFENILNVKLYNTYDDETSLLKNTNDKGIEQSDFVNWDMQIEFTPIEHIDTPNPDNKSREPTVPPDPLPFD